MRRAISEQSRGVWGILPRNILNSTLAEMQSSAKFLGTQINIKSSRLGYCKHTSYTKGGGGLECLGEKLGCLGGKVPPHWIEP